MPLVIVAGRPCVGKTAVAEALAAYLREGLSPSRRVVVVNAESLGLHKGDAYASAWPVAHLAQPASRRRRPRTALTHVARRRTHGEAHARAD